MALSSCYSQFHPHFPRYRANTYDLTAQIAVSGMAVWSFQNLVNEVFWKERFCRNLLIYCDEYGWVMSWRIYRLIFWTLLIIRCQYLANFRAVQMTNIWNPSTRARKFFSLHQSNKRDMGNFVQLDLQNRRRLCSDVASTSTYPLWFVRRAEG